MKDSNNTESKQKLLWSDRETELDLRTASHHIHAATLCPPRGHLGRKLGPCHLCYDFPIQNTNERLRLSETLGMSLA